MPQQDQAQLPDPALEDMALLQDAARVPEADSLPQPVNIMGSQMVPSQESGRSLSI